jgi:hypothetical protein
MEESNTLIMIVFSVRLSALDAESSFIIGKSRVTL